MYAINKLVAKCIRSGHNVKVNIRSTCVWVKCLKLGRNGGFVKTSDTYKSLG
jgi:hypothetical protein